MTKLTKRSALIAAAVLAAGVFGASTLLSGDAAAVETGQRAPAFSVRDASGATRTLSEFAGRTLVLEWTNHGCPYVRKHYDAGNMQALQRAAAEDGVVWLQIISSRPGAQGYLDAAGARARVATDNAAPAATLLDADGVMGRAYGARVSPHMFIINPQGVIVYQGAIDDRPSARPASLEGATNYVSAALADLAAGRAVQTTDTTPYGCTVKYEGVD
ncbi:MAG: redoxin domain-containing protein [Terricaulis sp.]|nr:redoxin domain-containing protein [Terricaulis sp.]